MFSPLDGPYYMRCIAPIMKAPITPKLYAAIIKPKAV